MERVLVFKAGALIAQSSIDPVHRFNRAINPGAAGVVISQWFVTNTEGAISTDPHTNAARLLLLSNQGSLLGA